LRRKSQAEVIIVGGGLAGLSAAIYLSRAKRDVLVIDSGKSMARWEPEVQNYLGFPESISGERLVDYGWKQACAYGARFAGDKILSARRTRPGRFSLRGQRRIYRCNRLLLATGIFHIPPSIPGITRCLGHTMFFCKDCDGYRVQGKRLAIYGWTNEAAEYALAMLIYVPWVALVTDTRPPRWTARYTRLLQQYGIPVITERITRAVHLRKRLRALHFAGRRDLPLDALFAMRGDIFMNKVAKALGCKVDEEGQIEVNECKETSVKGVYAAGCVTPANCQMIIAAGQGATAAQAINRDLFCESLKTRTLRPLGPGQRTAFRSRGLS